MRRLQVRDPIFSSWTIGLSLWTWSLTSTCIPMHNFHLHSHLCVTLHKDFCRCSLLTAIFSVASKIFQIVRSKIIFLCEAKGRLLPLPTELFLPWQQFCARDFWLKSFPFHLLIYFNSAMQSFYESIFNEGWNRKNQCSVWKPNFHPVSSI